MFAKLPDWRWQELQKAHKTKIPPTDSFMRDVYDVMVRKKDDYAIKRAIEIYNIPVFRDTVVAFFLSGASLEQTEVGIEVPIPELIIFEQLFIDSMVFRNRLEWRAYAQHYADNLSETEKGGDEVRSGVLYGPTSLQGLWRKGNQIIDIPTKTIVADNMFLAHRHAMVGRGTAILAAESKEAFKWSSIAMRGAVVRDNINVTDELESDAIEAIHKRKATMTADEAGLGLADILH